MRTLFVDLSTRLDTVYDLGKRARGGMVTSLFIVSNSLAARGHDVAVLAGIDNPGRTVQGVQWHNRQDYPQDAEWDALVLNRGVHNGLPEISARKRVLWTHDLPHSGFCPHPKTLRAIDRVVFMSRYAERVWRSMFTGIGESELIPNGVQKILFRPADEKDLNYLIFASAPNRGLKRLPLIFEAIKSRVAAPVRMRAYSNMRALHPNEVRDDEHDGFSLAYKNCLESGIERLDPVPQPELAEELGKAGLMIIPSDYPEICSNVILQALASGVPVITTGNLGSAGEWVRSGVNGVLTEYAPVDYMVYQVEIVRAAVGILENPKKHRRMIAAAAKTKNIASWEQIGTRWEKMLRRLC